MRIRHRLLVVMLGLLAVVTLGFSITIYRIQREALVGGLNGELYAAANIVRDLLPKDYHDRIQKKDSISDEEYHQIVARFDNICVKAGMEYLWSLMLLDGKVVFTSGTSPSKDVSKHDHAHFLEVHSNPELYTNVFQTMQPQFQINEDKWGRIQAVLVPFRDSHGRPYLTGASRSMAKVDAALRHTLITTVLAGGLVMCIGIIACLVLANNLAKPIEKVTQAASAMALGDFRQTVESDETKELQVLGDSINAMGKSIQTQISALVESRENLRITLQCIGDAVISTDNRGQVAWMNPVAEMLTGWTQAEAMGRPLKEVFRAINGKTQQPLEDPGAQVLREGKTIRLCQDTVLLARDGHQRQVDESSAPIRDPQGIMVGVVLVFRDVTEAYAKDQALRESKERLKASQRVAHLGHFTYDVARNTWTASDTMEEILGIVPDYPKTIETWNQIVFSEDRQKMLDYAQQEVIGKKLPFDLEYRIQRINDGVVRWVHGVAAVELDAQGRAATIFGIIQDITARKLAEEALRISEQRLNHALEAISEGLWDWNLQNGAIYCSPRYHTLLGYQVGELPLSYEQWKGMVHPDDVDELMGKFERYLGLGGLDLYRVEFRMRNRVGDWRWMLCRGKIVEHDDGGKAVRMVGTLADVTEQKWAESSLRESERRFRDIMEHMRLLTTMIDKNGCILFCNNHFLQITGWSRPEVMGKNWFQLFIPPEEGQKIWQFFQSLLRGGLQHYYENEILCRNGERRLVAWNNTCLRDLSGTIIGVAGIGEDITERRRLENQFRQAQKMEAVGQLAGGVAHDFNNILAATMINLSLLQTNPHLDAETRETLKELELESRRASQLVRQLLQFSRKSVMRIKRLNVNEVLENLFKMLRRLIGENIRIEWNADSGLPQIEADSGMLEQVVVNLCLNARDAMPQGGILKISTRTCEIGRNEYPAQPERLAGLYVVIVVGDTGCGMDDETMQHLFEPFFTTKEIGRGTGLGLASVYGIVKQHGGWVEVESQVDKGSKFAVFLPVELAHDSEIGASISEVPPQRGTEVVLLVEDEITLRRAARQTLHLLGYEVLEANHGREALGLWQQRGGRIDLLLTDLVLPEALTGLDLAARLRSEKPGLKVIITTGYNSKSDQSGVPTDMGYLYLPKPYDVNALADMVRRCLDLKA